MQIAVACKCGKGRAFFNLRDNLLPAQVVVALYCPECSPGVSFNPNTMVKDNGWIVEFDMDVARFYISEKLSIDPEDVTPEFVFDDGWATWRGIYPGEEDERAKELDELKAILGEDPRRYFEAFRDWATRRMERLRKEGWRKAQPKHPASAASRTA